MFRRECKIKITHSAVHAEKLSLLLNVMASAHNSLIEQYRDQVKVGYGGQDGIPKK
jgi:hypothetical protein